MYNSNFVLAIKVDGKILRETNETVYLPFGSEYSVFLKNLSDRRASVKIFIDGSDIGDGTSFLVNAKSSADITRFIKNGNTESGNSLKFIEKTDKIEKYRGNKAEDGLVRIEYTFEKVYQKIHYYTPIIRKFHDDINYNSFYNSSDVFLQQYAKHPTGYSSSTTTYNSTDNVASSNVLRSTTASIQNIAGVTAPGSENNQKFTHTYGFISDDITHSMCLKLLGKVESAVIQTPVVVKKSKKCIMCGTVGKQTAKFCSECGASINIID